MKELIELPDEHLSLLTAETKGNNIMLYVESTEEVSRCPYCGKTSGRVHSRYERILHDLPIQGRKVKLILNNKKYFCENERCTHKTFAAQFAFYKPKATKTNRLQDEILEVSLTQSSMAASKYLKKNVVAVGKSTICTMLKKTGKQGLIKKQ